jgi:hypothetical protein
MTTTLAVGLQGTGSDGTTPSPFMRLMLLWMAIGHHWRRAAALPPGSVFLKVSGNPREVSALRAALRQQLTPSCCTQLVQRVAPAYWAVVTAEQVPKTFHEVVTLSALGDSGQNIPTWLRSLGHMADMYGLEEKPCWALGEHLGEVCLQPPASDQGCVASASSNATYTAAAVG